MNENKTTLDSEIRKMFRAGISQKSIHKHLEGKHVAADIANAIQVVRTEIDLEEKKKELAKRAVLETEIRESVYRLAKEFEDNDTGIDPDDIAALEKKIKGRLTDEYLEAFNTPLSKKARRLTHWDIAFVASVHRKSIWERKDGTSDYKRIRELSKLPQLMPNPLDNRQIKCALDALSAIKFTRQTKPHVRPSFQDGQRIKGQAGSWELDESDYWA